MRISGSGSQAWESSAPVAGGAGLRWTGCHLVFETWQCGQRNAPMGACGELAVSSTSMIDGQRSWVFGPIVSEQGCGK